MLINVMSVKKNIESNRNALRWELFEILNAGAG